MCCDNIILKTGSNLGIERLLFIVSFIELTLHTTYFGNQSPTHIRCTLD